jgi:release factor glutamine methyltransferase
MLRDRVSWTIGELLKTTAKYLKEKRIESPRLTAEVLLAHELGMDRVGLYLQFEKPLTEKELSGYRDLVRRRVRGEPLQYVTGVQEFWSMAFEVGPGVLIPRPETELLVEQGLACAKEDRTDEGYLHRLLDLGTGSGIIAVSLAKELPEWDVWATDISTEALHMAQINAEKHGVHGRIRFRQGDLFDAVRGEGRTFAIIVSNPPYVEEEEYGVLPPEVREHEPRTALAGGPGGMTYVARILREAPDFLIPNGWLLVEMAPGQTERAMKIAEETRCYGEARRIRDYSGRHRVVCVRRS